MKIVLIALALLLGSWALLVLLAARLPPGLLKDLAGFLPACVTMIRRLRRDPRVPRSAKIAVLIAMVWVISPIDLIPEFLPVIGPLDDVVVVIPPVAPEWVTPLSEGIRWLFGSASSPIRR